MVNSEDLEPCPFCAAEELEVTADGRVLCPSCGVAGPVPRHRADRAWNRRETARADEGRALFGAQIALLKSDLSSVTVNERFSQIMLGFTAGTLAVLFGQLDQIRQLGLAIYAQTIGGLLLCSLLCGAAQLLVGHVVALAAIGFDKGYDKPLTLGRDFDRLSPEAKLQLLRDVMSDTAATRSWPEREWILGVVRSEDFVGALVKHLLKLRRFVQWQVLFFRFQVIFAACAAFPAWMAIAS